MTKHFEERILIIENMSLLRGLRSQYALIILVNSSVLLQKYVIFHKWLIQLFALKYHLVSIWYNSYSRCSTMTYSQQQNLQEMGLMWREVRASEVQQKGSQSLLSSVCCIIVTEQFLNSGFSSGCIILPGLKQESCVEMDWSL